MSKEYSTIENLIKQVRETNAAEGHVEIGGVHGDDNLTAVVSVYDGKRAGYKVLNELYEWAEVSGNTELTDKIEELDRLKEDE